MNKDYIIENLKKQITEADTGMETKKVGKVVEVGDGVAKIVGLDDVMMSEMVKFETRGDSKEEVYGVTMNLEEGEVGVIVIGSIDLIKEGDTVVSTGQVLSVPANEKMIGRVISPIGEAIDGGEPIESEEVYPIEKIAPGVVTREEVKQPLQTGIKSIDAMIPIGRGQRELIIGDRQTGKTAIAIDAIINQKDQDVICIYVAIGQKKSKVAQIVSKLEEHGALDHTVVVLAGASDPAAYSFMAPYAGCTIGEYFMDQGKDVLIVYDDLSKHAAAYRQISLLLRRPPGREAYPGDVFYLHSRLLERAAKLNKNYGGGSLTALPIIETQAGDISAFIPTNVISITDGQIFLEADLFYQGFRPAINVGLSVSRVGSSAQIKAMKKVAGKVKLELAQFRELEAFTQFGSDLDERTKQKIERGYRTREVLKQDQYASLPVEKQVVVMWALNNGYFDDIKVEETREKEKEMLQYFEEAGKEVLKKIREKKELDEELESEVKKTVEAFKNTLPAEEEAEESKESGETQESQEKEENKEDEKSGKSEESGESEEKK
ncbi:MAG: F0F1 ATP synthase subunit alpha [Candidatus Moranbacteria bacterium]|nr:F0F1 ATP synthase subunit alpha [Candidatus Moranbacteria bacterium]